MEQHYSLYFEDLLKERDNISMNSLLGMPTDFTRLREVASHFEEINTTGTDEELWESVLAYIKPYLP